MIRVFLVLIVHLVSDCTHLTQCPKLLVRIKDGQTCIDCHKGVAHLAPQQKLDTSEFDHLFDLAKKTPEAAKEVYPISTVKMGELATVNPTTALQVVKADGNKRTVEISGFQMKGAEAILYLDNGKRAILATVTEKGQKALKLGEYVADSYGNQWRSASLTGEIDQPVLNTREPVWKYANDLNTVYCSTCHAKIPTTHFTVNAWPPVAKAMGSRTDISADNLEILTKYFQYHAKDMKGQE